MTYTRTHKLVIAGASLWCFLVLIAPIYNLDAVYAFFRQICHQLPNRSWWLDGSPLPVCIRCASIYMGFLVGSGAGFQPNPPVLLTSLVATLAEFTLSHFILDSAWLRASSGFALGFAVAPFIVVGIEEMIFNKAWQSKKVARDSV